jgi:hypothetical protein
MDVCTHVVSPRVDKPNICFYLVREPHRSWHLTWSAGTCDNPGDVHCFEFGPFDRIEEVTRYVAEAFTAWANTCNQGGW